MSEEKVGDELIAKLTKDVNSLSSYILLRRETAQKELDEANDECRAAHELLQIIFEDEPQDRSKYGFRSYYEAEGVVRGLREKISSLEGELQHMSLSGMR